MKAAIVGMRPREAHNMRRGGRGSNGRRSLALRDRVLLGSGFHCLRGSIPKLMCQYLQSRSYFLSIDQTSCNSLGMRRKTRRSLLLLKHTTKQSLNHRTGCTHEPDSSLWVCCWQNGSQAFVFGAWKALAYVGEMMVPASRRCCR